MLVQIYQKSKLAFAFLTLLLVSSMTLATDIKQVAHAQPNIETYQVSIHSSGNSFWIQQQLVNVLIPPDSSVISYDLASTTNVYVASFQYQGCFSMRYLKFAQAYINFTRSNPYMDGDFSVKVTVSRNTVPYSPCINDNLADKIIERLKIDNVSVSWAPYLVFANLERANDWKGYPILPVQKAPGFTLPPSKVDYLVITSAQMQPLSSGFLLWKQEQGLGTFVETIEDINKVYIGDTIQSKTVEFLRDAFDAWHMTYVLIVGNVGILPPLYYQVYNCSIIGGMTDTVSTDYCYMALEQNVSALSYDHIVGGTSFSFPDYILGRFPFDDPTQVQTLFQKTITYENNTNPGQWARTNLVVFGQDVGPDPAPFLNSSNERLCISLQYGVNLTLAGLVDHINNGVGSVFLWNHANPSEWWLGGNEYFDINAAQSLSNTRLPIIFSEGCHCGKWDAGTGGSGSVAVKLLGMSGGAVAIVGGTWYTPLGDLVFLSAYNYWKSEYGFGGLPRGLPRADYDVGRAFFYFNALAGVYPDVDLLGDPSIVLATANYDVPKEILVCLKNVRTWCWANATAIQSVAKGDVDGDGKAEVVTGGYYNDGTRNEAQLCVWNGATLALKSVRTWYWTSDTEIESVAVGDVDGDGKVEVVTGGLYNDGARYVAQLCVWNGATLALKNVRAWYWTSWTKICSVAVGDVDADGKAEVVTGGWYFDGARYVAQLCVWNGATLALKSVRTWYWTGNTQIESVAVGDVDGDGKVEVVTGGLYNDGARYVAQLCVWDGATLALENVEAWYWAKGAVIWSVAVGDVDGDGKVEVVTGGYYFDGTREVAQLCVWNGATLALKNVQTWYWTGATSIFSVAVADVDADGKIEIVTGGNYYYILRLVAQLCVWNGATLALKNVQTWYWTSDTVINSVAVGDVDGDSNTEVVTGGHYNDGTRDVAQLCVWG